jgi:hypothetical protein
MILALALSVFACGVVEIQNNVIQQQRYNINQMTKNPACTLPLPVKLSDN